MGDFQGIAMITATCTWSSLPSHLPTNAAHKTLLMLFKRFASQTCLSSRSSPQDDPCSPERWNSNLSSVVHVLQSLILTNMHKHTHKKNQYNFVATSCIFCFPTISSADSFQRSPSSRCCGSCFESELRKVGPAQGKPQQYNANREETHVQITRSHPGK